MARALKVFYSYAHEDVLFRNELGSQLMQLERRGIIETWDDRKLPPGCEWDGVIREKLNEADVIVFLVSRDFEESKYCWDVEVDRAFERWERGTAQILAVYVRPVLFETSRFQKVESLPKTSQGKLRPVKKWSLREDAYVAIAHAIKDMAGSWAGSNGGPNTPERFWDVPERTADLVGRESLLGRLSEQFALAGDRAAAALVGGGGVGKTAVAVEFAWRHRAEYDLVAWLHAEEATCLEYEYGRLADRVGCAATSLDGALAAFRQWLVDKERWLLVFDNAIDPDIVERLVPESVGGHVIVTSREHVWSRIAREVPVTALEDDDAVGYILNGTQSTDRATARSLATSVRRVPRALEDAVATIGAENISLVEYLHRVVPAPSA